MRATAHLPHERRDDDHFLALQRQPLSIPRQEQKRCDGVQRAVDGPRIHEFEGNEMSADRHDDTRQQARRRHGNVPH